MNNPLTNAFNALQNNFSDAGRGTNPLFAPQVGELFGFNIPGVPLISTRDYFLLQMQSWLTSVPLMSQWIAVVDSYPKALRSDLIQGLERTDGARKGYDISQAKTLLTSYPLQKVIGCVFAQGATIPSESYSVASAKINNNRGFIPGIVAGDRRDYAGNSLVLNFLETNTSFIDFVIRPWIILASHYGFCARPDDTPTSRDFYNIKSTITLLCYTRSYQNISMIPRKVYRFFNCAPTLVNNISLNYNGEPTQATNYSVQWTYTNYTVENSMYFPLADIINNVSSVFNGNYTPTVSPLQDAATNGTNIFNPAGFF